MAGYDYQDYEDYERDKKRLLAELKKYKDERKEIIKWVKTRQYDSVRKLYKILKLEG